MKKIVGKKRKREEDDGPMPSKKRKIKKEEKKVDMCVICFNDMLPHQNIKTTECDHKFHKNCLEKWFSGANTCPLCNRVHEGNPRQRVPEEPMPQILPIPILVFTGDIPPELQNRRRPTNNPNNTLFSPTPPREISNMPINPAPQRETNNHQNSQREINNQESTQEEQDNQEDLDDEQEMMPIMTMPLQVLIAALRLGVERPEDSQEDDQDAQENETTEPNQENQNT
ncbi:RING finger protein [Candidatus Dependentiae bacterium]